MIYSTYTVTPCAPKLPYKITFLQLQMYYKNYPCQLTGIGYYLVIIIKIFCDFAHWEREYTF